ncbi:MAG: hypothetical protein IPJ41_04565 [Phycisphaerales bacterium]|nr:hypothetical protein [Phycisphaerales bacterium]
MSGSSRSERSRSTPGDAKRRLRTGHATTTLVQAGTRGAGGPGPARAAIAARLNERAGLEASDITHVFLTSFRARHLPGIRAFENAGGSSGA